MIELRGDALQFSFPEVHPDARLSIDFQRTLRIPDDGRDYPLPAGLGRFPIRHVDDHADRLSPAWVERGGVMLPMWQAESLWINFDPHFAVDRDTAYPFAIKIAAGKINAVTGDAWTNGLHRDPQDYVVAPEQPWLDGFCVERGVIRQFVAMPLGQGYSAEEQLTGKSDFGGIQLIAYPMRRDVFERRFPKQKRTARYRTSLACCEVMSPAGAMGLAAGGRMRQEIAEDPFDPNDWDTTSSRCFVHLVNASNWQHLTGQAPPTHPPTNRQYEMAGLPWFNYYDESIAPVDGSPILRTLESVFTLGKEKNQHPLPENTSIPPQRVLDLRAGLKKEQVREGNF